MEELKHKISDKITKVVYSELCKMGVEFVELGETFIIGKSEYKGLKIEIKVNIK